MAEAKQTRIQQRIRALVTTRAFAEANAHQHFAANLMP